MTQHPPPSFPSRPAVATQVRWHVPRFGTSATLLEGVAAQDALARLFDESAATQPSDAPDYGQHHR